jgi:hypothetical protein
MPKFKIFYQKENSYYDSSCTDNYIIVSSQTEVEARRWASQLGHIVIHVEHL